MIIFIPVVDASLGFPVPKAELHSSRDIDGQTALELDSGSQAGLQRDHLSDRRRRGCDHMDTSSENGLAGIPHGLSEEILKSLTSKLDSRSFLKLPMTHLRVVCEQNQTLYHVDGVSRHREHLGHQVTVALEEGHRSELNVQEQGRHSGKRLQIFLPFIRGRRY